MYVYKLSLINCQRLVRSSGPQLSPSTWHFAFKVCQEHCIFLLAGILARRFSKSEQSELGLACQVFISSQVHRMYHSASSFISFFSHFNLGSSNLWNMRPEPTTKGLGFGMEVWFCLQCGPVGNPKKEPTIWGLLTPPIYGDLGNDLLLGLPH